MSNFSQPNSNDPLDIDLDLYPKGWKATSLGDLVEKGVIWIKNGYAQGTHNQDGQGIPHLRPFNISTNGQIDLSQIKYVTPPETDSPYRVYPKDVVFNNTNSEELVGKTAFFKNQGDYVLSNHMTIIRVMNENVLDAYWLSKQLLYLWQKGVVRSICRRHVNQASVSLARLNSIEVPIPPLPEQRVIAHVLSTVREAIEATERVIAAARELKRSLMKHLFTYGPVSIDQVKHIDLIETETGIYPSHWRKGRFDDFAILQRGFDITKKEQKPGNVPVVSSSGIRSYHDTAQVKGPGVVIGRKGSLGTVHYVNCDYWPHDTTLWVKDFKGNYPKYLFYFLTTLNLENLDTGTSNPTLNRNYVHALKIAFPQPETQRQISKMIKPIEDKIGSEKGRKDVLNSLFDSLLRRLMTGDLRVGISSDK